MEREASAPLGPEEPAQAARPTQPASLAQLDRDALPLRLRQRQAERQRKNDVIFVDGWGAERIPGGREAG